MNEKYVILKVKFGYFNGVNYDTNEAIWSDLLQNYYFICFDSEFEAQKRLSELMNECKKMNGLYEIVKFIMIA